MAIYYSASAHGFFDSAIHMTLPDDAVRISPARHADLLAAQADGATIEANGKGKPRLRRRPLEDARARLLREVKKEAARRIDAVAPLWRQINDQRNPTPAAAHRFAAIDAIRAASDLIEAEIAAAPTAALSTLIIARHLSWPAE